jgi:hypothetical protein
LERRYIRVYSSHLVPGCYPIPPTKSLSLKLSPTPRTLAPSSHAIASEAESPIHPIYSGSTTLGGRVFLLLIQYSCEVVYRLFTPMFWNFPGIFRLVFFVPYNTVLWKSKFNKKSLDYHSFRADDRKFSQLLRRLSQLSA